MNSYEMLGRERKARKLLAVCQRVGITPEDAEGASQEDWGLAAQIAGVNPPSAETQRKVIQMLKGKDGHATGNRTL